MTKSTKTYQPVSKRMMPLCIAVLFTKSLSFWGFHGIRAEGHEFKTLVRHVTSIYLSGLFVQYISQSIGFRIRTASRLKGVLTYIVMPFTKSLNFWCFRLLRTPTIQKKKKNLKKGIMNPHTHNIVVRTLICLGSC